MPRRYQTRDRGSRSVGMWWGSGEALSSCALVPQSFGTRHAAWRNQMAVPRHLAHSVRALRSLAFSALIACGTTDDRPATVEVVSLEILAPTCGAVQCHSTTTRTEGLAFDTLDEAKASMRDLGVRA